MIKKTKINMGGGGFSHTISSTGLPTKYVEWIRGYASANITIHIDNYMVGRTASIYRKTKEYAWLCEAKSVSYFSKRKYVTLEDGTPSYEDEKTSLYEWCKNNIPELKEKFIKVFTHDTELAKMDDIFQLTLCSGKSFLTEGKIYPKSKLVSMIASNKVMCEEHEYRQEMIEKYSKLGVDHFGSGFNFIQDQADGLKDYCFSIAMENATYSNMFTEKLTDCFMTGTIPVYYGIDNIGDFFNTDGIIIMDDDFDIKDLTVDLYNSKKAAILDNYNRAQDLLCAEDYIFKQFIEPSL
jgi:hypothetical protein